MDRTKRVILKSNRMKKYKIVWRDIVLMFFILSSRSPHTLLKEMNWYDGGIEGLQVVWGFSYSLLFYLKGFEVEFQLDFFF